jgi:hypothetical protein
MPYWTKYDSKSFTSIMPIMYTGSLITPVILDG